MPSVEWNKETWTQQLKDYETVNIPYYGAQWGNPDPRGVFPSMIRPFIPEFAAAALLNNKSIRRLLHRAFKPTSPFYPELYHLIQQYIRPNVTPQSLVLEIGPGGGRFTRYLLDAREIILVDIVPDFFEYIKQRFPQQASKMRFYEPKNHELEGIESNSVDYVMTFDAFVHIEPEGIREYLQHIARVLKPGSIAVIHYGDITKKAAEEKERFFAPMDSQKMDSFVQQMPELTVIAHDKTFLLHSNLIVLRKSPRQ
jgi:SAM-dependent methyltransferase